VSSVPPSIVVAAVIAACAAAPAMPQDPALTLFDRLSLPSLKDAALVRVATGDWSQTEDEDPQPWFEYGYLLADDGATFEVLTDRLDRLTLTRTPPGTPTHACVGFVPVVLPRPGDPAAPAWSRGPEYRGEDGYHAPGTVLAFHAWASAARGDLVESDRLGARALESFRNAADRNARARDLAAHLARAVGHGEFWRLIVDFGDPSIPYLALHARTVRWRELFPGHDHAARAAEVERTLARMLAEDRAWPAPDGSPTVDALARELAFRLRDQNGQQWGQPGSCDLFADPRGDDSPLTRITALGVDAVPALIDVFDDDSFTRSVGYHRDFYFSHRVLRVADCARAALARITGESFESADAARAWLAGYRARGERAAWVDSAARGNLTNAARLVAHHPEAALAPLRTAFAGTDEARLRARLVALAARLDTADARAFVVDQLAPDAEPLCRLHAACALFPTQRDAVVDAVLAAWRAAVVERRGDQETVFLALTGEARAIDALAERPQRLYAKVFDALATGRARLHGVDLPRADGGWDTVVQLREAPWSDEALAATERVCLAALEDERRPDVRWRGTQARSIADGAADALHERWPARYPFHADAPRRVRARQVLAIRNADRQRRGEAPLADPYGIDLAPLDAAVIEPLLARLGRAASDDERRPTAAAIEEIGPDAVPHLARAIATAGHGDPTPFAALARRLTARVAAARVHPASAPVDDELLAQVAAAVGAPLDPELPARLAAHLLRTQLHVTAGCRVEVHRDPGGAGLVIVLWSLPRAGESRPDVVGVDSHLVLGMREERGGSVSGGAGQFDHPDAHRGFTAMLREMLAAPWDTPVEGCLELRW
jgi:hypothetical protein